MPKVSILVPVYNVEKYLKECLESLINQTLKDIEIIVINDGSTDGSASIAEEYAKKDNRIKLINKENTGYGNSMNTGLKAASGEYTGIIESDDFCKTTMFEELYNLAQKHNSDIARSEYFEYTTKDGKGQARKTGKFTKFKTNKPFSLKDNPSLVRIPPNIWTSIYKTEFLKTDNINFAETKGASYQDTSFFFKTLCLAKKIVLTNKAYVYYRCDNANSSVHSKQKVFSICDEYDEITNFLNQNPEIKSFINSQKLIKQYYAYMWNLKRINENLQTDFVERFSQEFKNYFDLNEINNEFYSKINKKEFQMLIQDKKAFMAHIEKRVKMEKLRDKRKKLFSIHINTSRVSIVMFGRSVLEIG